MAKVYIFPLNFYFLTSSEVIQRLSPEKLKPVSTTDRLLYPSANLSRCFLAQFNTHKFYCSVSTELRGKDTNSNQC